MTEQPSAYDILQDNRLDGLEELVTPYYQPPSEVEHSFPVVGQGVSADMYQQMSLAQGDGVLITDDSEFSYRLVGHSTDSETNSQNSLILKVSENTHRNEAVLAGFYHVMYEDMTIPIPPVTSDTTYYICLTYDPRREEEESGPIRVEVHTNSLPRTHGRKHIVLHTVQRRPNQLLTEAIRTTHRQRLAPTISVSFPEVLPDATDVLYGTLGVIRARTSGGEVVPGTAQIYESRGIHGWHNMFKGPWQNCTDVRSSWTGTAVARYKLGDAQLRASIRSTGPGTLSDAHMELFRLPSGMRPETSIYFQASTTPDNRPKTFYVDSDGWVRNAFAITDTTSYIRMNTTIPLD